MRNRIEFEPLTGCIGARVHGVDLNGEIGDELMGELRRRLLDHLVLLFPNQDLSPAAHVALGQRLGELTARHPIYRSVEGFDDIMIIENGPDRSPDSEEWHKDMTFRSNPPQCSLLHAKVLPSRGGDTMFANLQAVYDDLSPEMQAFLEGLTAVHDMEAGFGRSLLRNGEHERLAAIRGLKEEDRTNVHPVVGIHPITGRKYLGIDDCFVSRIVELSDRESDGVLGMLRAIIKEPKYHLRIRWQPNDLGVWDNVSTQHIGVGDYNEYRRMHRVTVGRYHDVAAVAA